ncbi:MAG: AAA family ATPase [Promethearchaeota archaeon]
MTFSDDEIKERLGKYGAVYLPSEIKESIDDILGNESKKDRLEDFFKALKKYEEISEQFKKSNLIPNFTVLLYGPPGTGKTSLTRAFSKKYNIPICVIESDRLVSPLLGDTIKNIRNAVELASEIAKENGAFVLFFDEIDAIGSERSNIHEVGEIKRAVISFLQVIDRINYEGIPLAIFGATNHQNQLDSAIWRRFTFHLKFDFPNYTLRKKIIESFLNKLKNMKIGIDETIYLRLNEEHEKIEKISKDLTKKLGHEISEFEDNLLWKEFEKRYAEDGLLKLTIGYSGSDIERGIKVALFKAFHTGLLTYDMFYESLKLVGGTAIHVNRQDLLSTIREDNLRSKRSKLSIEGPPEI